MTVGFACLVNSVAASFIESGQSQAFAGRANVAVIGLIVSEFTCWKNALMPGASRLCRSHVGADSPLLQTAIVLHRPVLSVGYERLHGASRGCLVLINKRFGATVFLDVAGRRFHRCDHSAFVVDRPVVLVARAGVAAATFLAMTHAWGVGIGGAHQLPVLPLVVGIARTPGQFLLLGSIGAA